MTCAGIAVEPELPEPARLAYEAEAHAYNTKRPPKGGRKFLLEAREVYELDANAILALRCVIEDFQPGWVEEVKDACRMSNCTRWIANWCELSLAATQAIIDNLKARGEIPPDGDWS